jgi:hypothetical protein
MSSTKQATFSPSNFQLIIDAKLTGIDLSNSPFAERLKLSTSTQAILELLEKREKDFKEYRDRNLKLISCISPAVERSSMHFPGHSARQVWFVKPATASI